MHVATQTGFEESIYPFLSTNWQHSWYKTLQKEYPSSNNVDPSCPSSCPNLRLPFCLQRRLHFFVGEKKVRKVSLTWASMVDWLMTISAIVWTWQTKYLETWWKKNVGRFKKNGVNTAYSKCTCMFTKFVSRFVMLCFFSHLHVLHYCCCEPKATNQRNVFWVRCKCHIWFGIIPVS